MTAATAIPAPKSESVAVADDQSCNTEQCDERDRKVERGGPDEEDAAEEIEVAGVGRRFQRCEVGVGQGHRHRVEIVAVMLQRVAVEVFGDCRVRNGRAKPNSRRRS